MTKDHHRKDQIARQKIYRKAYHIGKFAEKMALVFLWLKGYRVLAKRVRTPVGEVDLLMAHSSSLIVVEVKWRQSIDKAVLSISAKQKCRLNRAGAWLLVKYPGFDHIRFDVVAIANYRLPKHIKAAWRSDT